MSFLSVCFVIILICALIGPENIINVLTFAIPIVIIGFILLKKWSNKVDKENAERRTNLESKYFNQSSHFSQGYSNRPIITGDYFSASWQSSDDTVSNYRYCQHANLATCANCAKRREHFKDHLYYYGVSEKCKDYVFTYDD